MRARNSDCSARVREPARTSRAAQIAQAAPATRAGPFGDRRKANNPVGGETFTPRCWASEANAAARNAKPSRAESSALRMMGWGATRARAAAGVTTNVAQGTASRLALAVTNKEESEVGSVVQGASARAAKTLASATTPIPRTKTSRGESPGSKVRATRVAKKRASAPRHERTKEASAKAFPKALDTTTMPAARASGR